MEPNMFCYQCQETAKGTGCILKGVCGKESHTAQAMDLLLFVVRGVSVVADVLRKADCPVSEEVNIFVTDALFCTITNANFDDESILKRVDKGITMRNGLIQEAKHNKVLLPKVDELTWQGTRDDYAGKAKTVGVLREQNEDLRSLKELLVYGLKGMAAYLEHAMRLGFNDDTVHVFMQRALATIAVESLSAEEWVKLMVLGDMTGGSFDSSVVGASIMALVTYYSLYAVLYLLGTVMLTSLVYALVRTYNEREERLEGVTLGMLKPLLFRNVRRVFLIMIVSVLLVLFVGLIVGFIATIIPFIALAFLFVLLVVVVSVPLAIWAPVYLFEDIYIIDALKKAYRLGFATWGGIVLISIVMGFIAAILQGVTMIPWYIGTIVKYIFAMTDAGGGATVSAAYSFVLYLLAVVQAFGVYMSMIFSLLGLAYQYGHASEKIDYVMVESDIDNFDKL